LENAEKLYELKRRSRLKPLGLFVGDFAEMSKWASTHAVSQSLIDRLLPGPVTVVLERSKALPATFNPETGEGLSWISSFCDHPRK
jgi:tRNA A37 threonylcarbamoyladenosine synthetase subunit TsaC/SUA5/YrdC